MPGTQEEVCLAGAVEDGLERGGEGERVEVGKGDRNVSEVMLQALEGEGPRGAEGLGQAVAIGEGGGCRHGVRVPVVGVASGRLTRGSWRVCTVRV